MLGKLVPPIKKLNQKPKANKKRHRQSVREFVYFWVSQKPRICHPSRRKEKSPHVIFLIWRFFDSIIKYLIFCLTVLTEIENDV